MVGDGSKKGLSLPCCLPIIIILKAIGFDCLRVHQIIIGDNPDSLIREPGQHPPDETDDTGISVEWTKGHL